MIEMGREKLVRWYRIRRIEVEAGIASWRSPPLGKGEPATRYDLAKNDLRHGELLYAGAR